MLSVETTPRSSCSCEVSVLKTDERAPDRLACPEADPAGISEKQQPTPFSIRDYVFASRIKGIETNWPFPQKHLQLCLKHGIRDLLPPFEPPKLVRARCTVEHVRSYPQVSCIEGERNLAADVGSLDAEPIVIKPKISEEDKVIAVVERNFDDDQLAHGEADIESTVTIHDQIKLGTLPKSKLEVRSVSDALTILEVAKVPTFAENVEDLHEPPDEECRLTRKLGNVFESCWTEDIASNSSTVSDFMASKVCPVCKAFSSPSNTTLNAHIDQCLSVESSSKSYLMETSKHKVKPKKKRSMIDIYATAPHSTLEDLDRRNGSNWALDLTLVAPTNDVFTEIKRPKLSLLNPIHDGSEGDVYVDSTGTKLRILSKFNASTPTAAGETCKPGKLAKVVKEGKRFLVEKKNEFSPKCVKYMKFKPQSMKLGSFKPLRDEMSSEGTLQADNHQEKEVCATPLLSPQVHIRSSEPGTLRKWVCSKRSGLPKKLNSKCSFKSAGDLATIPQRLLVDQPDSSNVSANRSHIVKLSRPSDDFTSSQKTKSMDCLSKSIHAADYRGKDSQFPSEKDSSFLMGKNHSTANDLMVKMPRFSENQVSSPRSIRVEIHEVSQKSGGVLQNSPKSFEGCHRMSQKAKKKSILTKKGVLGRSSCTSGASRCNVVEKPVITKKLWKHRSLDADPKSREKLPSRVNEQFGCTIDSDFGLARTKLTNRTFNVPKNARRPKTSQSLGNVRESKKQTGGASIVERERYTSLKTLQLGIDCHCSDLANGDLQVKASANDAIPMSLGEVVGIASVSEGYAANSNGKLKSYRSLEEISNDTGGTEPWLEPSGPGLSEDPLMHCGYEVSKGTYFQKIQMAGQEENQGDLCSQLQQTECLTDTLSIRGSSACLTSHGDTCLEVSQENFSVSSYRNLPAQDDNTEVDKEASGSPVSVVSTISHPFNNSFESREDLERDPLDQPVAVQDKLIYAQDKSMVTIKGRCGSVCPSAQTQPQSRSIPILRLMGKNLMVINKEGDESVPLQKVVPQLSSLTFSSMGSISNQDILTYCHNQSQEDSVIMGQQCTSYTNRMCIPASLMRMSQFMDSPVPNSSKTTDMQAHQKKRSKETSSLFANRAENVTFHARRQKPICSNRASSLARVIDDSPKSGTAGRKGSSLSQPNSPATVLDSYIWQGRPFSCFPLQNHFLCRELSGEPKPGFQIQQPTKNFE